MEFFNQQMHMAGELFLVQITIMGHLIHGLF